MRKSVLACQEILGSLCVSNVMKKKPMRVLLSFDPYDVSNYELYLLEGLKWMYWY